LTTFCEVVNVQSSIINIKGVFMNGKDYVIKAIKMVEWLVSEIKKSKVLDGDPLLGQTSSACDVLSHIKNKATLRTKAGTNIAFPVYDAAQKLEEAWEEAQENEDTDELREQLEEFVSCVHTLGATLKERTVIMT
jgi:hypothetical protein